jgi:hypothetical protein
LVRIPNRPPIALVDLSPGGALIDLPFQVRPDSRVTLEFRAASERMIMPFRLLRCYVRSLRDGVQYQAAGEFAQQLAWKPLLADSAAQSTSNRLIATLQAFQRHGPASGDVMEFDPLLKWILDAARRGERADYIAVEIRVRLMRLIPTVVVKPATTPSLPDPAKGARFFGFDFRCERVLTGPERRLLRTAAQLLSIVDPAGNPGLQQTDAPSIVDPNGNPALMGPRPVDVKPYQNPEPPTIAYSVADWLEMRSSDGVMPHDDPWPRTA